MPPRAVAVTMLKGGTTKSTITAHTAEALGRAGYDVLAIDTDPNGHLTVNLGYENLYRDADADLGDVILSSGDADPDDVIVKTGLGFDLLPSSTALETVERQLSEEAQPSLCMQYELVQPLLGDAYDYIVIDTHSSRNMLVNNAVVAAPNLLLPVVPEQGIFTGLKRTQERIIDPLRERTGLEVLAVVPNKLHYRIDYDTSERRLIEGLCANERLAARVPNFAWVPPSHFKAFDDENSDLTPKKPGIRQSKAIDDAFRDGQTLGAYDPNHEQLACFDELAEIVIQGGVQRD